MGQTENTAGLWKTSLVREGGHCIHLMGKLRAQREVEKRGQDLELQSSQIESLQSPECEWEGAAWFSV